MDSAAGTLASIDYLIIIAYMLGVLAIGTFFGRYVRSAGDFFLGGKTLPFWAVGMSIVVSDIGAIDLVSGAGGASRYGIAQANFDWIGSMPAMVIAAFVFLPYYWRAGVYTIPEFLGRRYSGTVQVIQALIWLGFLISMLGVLLWTSAVFLGTVLGWNTTTAIWVTVAIVGIYTVSCGLTAVVMTDVMQMIVMFVGAGALLVLSLWEAGGWSGMVRTVLALGPQYHDHFTLLLPHDTATPYPWTGIVFGLGIVLSTAYFVGNQAVVQRALGARSEWDAKAGMLLAGFLKLFIPLLVVVPGLAATALYPHLKAADTAVPLLIRDLLPPGLTGLMFAAFLAALMSSVDSYLNSATTVFISDIYSKSFRLLARRDLSTRHALVLGRLVTAALIVAAGFFAPFIDRFETLYTAIQTLFSIFQGPTLAILLLGILWPRANRWGGLIGLLLGVGLTSTLTWLGDEVFPSQDPFLFVSFWSFLFSLAVTAAVSLVTPPEPPEKIRGLVFRQVLHDEQAQRLLRERFDR